MIHDALPAASASHGEHVVRDPQAGDVMADSLRAAYRRDSVVPVDIAHLLARLGDIELNTGGGYRR